MNKIYVVTTVDVSDSCDGHPSCCGCFKTADEAKNYVKNEMEDRRKKFAGCCYIQVDFVQMEILDACDQPICMWSIDEVEMP